MTSSAQPARKTTDSVDELLNESVRGRTAVAEKTQVAETADPFADIQSNPFFKAVLQGDLSPEERRKAVAQLTAGVVENAANREMAKALQQFRSFVQAHRLAMNEEIIALTNTKVMGELKRVYDQLNTSMLDFEDKIGPLVAFLDALFRLRTNGKTFDVIRKIKAEREEREANLRRRGEEQERKDSADRVIRELELQNSGLEEQKTFWGAGGIKESARVEIGKNKKRIADLETESQERARAIAAIDAEIAQKAEVTGEFALEEEQLRRMLDIDAEDHEQNQEAIVAAAQSYVKMTKERTAAVQTHLGSVAEQIERLMDANTNFGRVYAVLNDGVNDGIAATREKVGAIEAQPEGTSLTDKMIRDENVTTLNSHLGVLQEVAASTMEGFSDLTTEKARIKSIKDANAAQSSRIARYNDEGVAGVASRISTVLTAVNEAALGEASGMLGENMREMIRSTNRIAQKGVIQNAMGIEDRNAELEAAMEEVAGFSKVIQAATTLSREGMAELRGKLDEMANLAKGLQTDIHDSFAVAGEATKVEERVPDAPKAKASGFDFSKGA